MEQYTQALKEIYNLIDRHDTFLITSTEDPDGDSIGSQLALNLFLNRLNKKGVNIINQTGCPQKYQFLQGAELIKPIKDGYMTEVFDVGFVLDGGVERCGKVKTIFDRCKKKVIIDHHLYGSKASYDIALSDANSSSTAELVYILIKNYPKPLPIDAQIASAIYLGIVFDTGSFAYSLTNGNTHLIASELLNAGIDASYITEKCIIEKTISSLNLMNYLLQNLNISDDGKIIWTVITNEIMNKTGSKKEDIDSVINYLSFIKGVEVAVFLKEYDKDAFKISFRSRGAINVGRFCREIDNNGGGHARAAGCIQHGELKAVTNNIISKLKLYL